MSAKLNLMPEWYSFDHYISPVAAVIDETSRANHTFDFDIPSHIYFLNGQAYCD